MCMCRMAGNVTDVAVVRAELERNRWFTPAAGIQIPAYWNVAQRIAVQTLIDWVQL